MTPANLDDIDNVGHDVSRHLIAIMELSAIGKAAVQSWDSADFMPFATLADAINREAIDADRLVRKLGAREEAPS